MLPVWVPVWVPEWVPVWVPVWVLYLGAVVIAGLPGLGALSVSAWPATGGGALGGAGGAAS